MHLVAFQQYMIQKDVQLPANPSKPFGIPWYQSLMLCWINESLAVSPEIVEQDLSATYIDDLVDWTREQALYLNIRQSIAYLQTNKKPHKKEIGHNPMIRKYIRMKLIKNMLYIITTIQDEERQQLTCCTYTSSATSPIWWYGTSRKRQNSIFAFCLTRDVQG
jgi:hypothetical protein